MSNASAIFFQRYGQYALKFWHYNNDQDGDGNIAGDEDDRNIYRGPKVFENQATNPIRELYLFNDQDEQSPMRTLFRWKIIPDPNRPIGSNCIITPSNNIFTSHDNCIGVLQVLKLR